MSDFPRLVHSFTVSKIPTKNIKIYQINNFLTELECSKLIHFIEQEKVYRTTDSSNKKETIYLYDRMNQNEFYNYINQKIHSVLQIPLEFGEVIQVQQYNENDSISYHYDFFNELLEDEKRQLEKSGQRTWTFLIYLNNVQKGGETYFVEENLLVKPQVGKAILWKNLENGEPNYFTKHSGLPVIEGKKYIITKWFREKRIVY